MAQTCVCSLTESARAETVYFIPIIGAKVYYIWIFSNNPELKRASSKYLPVVCRSPSSYSR